MISMDDVRELSGKQVHGSDGAKIGKAGQVYLDDQSGRPEWVTVHTGLFGSAESFVPLAEAQLEGSGLRVPYDKDKVKSAPRVGDDGHLSPQEEDDLYDYYGLTDSPTSAGDAAGTAGLGTDRTTSQGTGYEGTGYEGAATGRTDRDAESTVGHDTSGHDTTGRSTDDAMTRSEESLRVGTEVREAGRARLRKFVVTERETVTVPVSHEEARIEREPITEANRGAAYDGPAISEEEHEVVLHEEVPVVSKEVHAVERVRLGTQTVTEQQQVTADVRKEQIELEDGTDTTGTTGRGGRER